MNPIKQFRGPTSISSKSAEHQSLDTSLAAANHLYSRNVQNDTVKKIRRKGKDEDETVQRKEKGKSRSEVSSGFQSSLASTRGAGSTIGTPLKNTFEGKFGADFGGVRIHNDKKAHQLATSVNARAFTVGKDIYFNKGEYQPETNHGQRLLAHELTHVVQQSKEVRRSVKEDDEKISRTSEEQISRWTISGDTATVSKKGDTLAQLAKDITGNWLDWKCIWIDNMKNEDRSWDRGYERWIEIGDTFDISNLNATTGVSATIVFDGADQYLTAVQTIYGGTNASADFMEQLELLANNGDTPIQSLTLVGHSNQKSMWGDNSSFSPLSVSANMPTPDGIEANNNMGPPRCWFTRNAVVRFVGCSSEHIAEEMAKNVLRDGSTAIGTNHWICGWNQTNPVVRSMVSSEGPPCNWPPTNTTYATPARFHGAAGLWVTHDGKQ